MKYVRYKYRVFFWERAFSRTTWFAQTQFSSDFLDSPHRTWLVPDLIPWVLSTCFFLDLVGNYCGCSRQELRANHRAVEGTVDSYHTISEYDGYFRMMDTSGRACFSLGTEKWFGIWALGAKFGGFHISVAIETRNFIKFCAEKPTSKDGLMIQVEFWCCFLVMDVCFFS